MSSIKRVKPFNKDDDSVMVFEFEGQLQYFTSDNVELYLTQFFKLREKLREEKRLRKEFPTLEEKYNEYLTLLALFKNYNKKD